MRTGVERIGNAQVTAVLSNYSKGLKLHGDGGREGIGGVSKLGINWESVVMVFTKFYAQILKHCILQVALLKMKMSKLYTYTQF